MCTFNTIKYTSFPQRLSITLAHDVYPLVWRLFALHKHGTSAFRAFRGKSATCGCNTWKCNIALFLEGPDHTWHINRSLGQMLHYFSGFHSVSNYMYHISYGQEFGRNMVSLSNVMMFTALFLKWGSIKSLSQYSQNITQCRLF